MIGTRRSCLALFLIAFAIVTMSPGSLRAGWEDAPAVALSAMPQTSDCASQGNDGMAGPCSVACASVAPALLPCSAGPEPVEGDAVSTCDEDLVVADVGAPDPRPPSARR
jgi:hypothetical protein